MMRGAEEGEKRPSLGELGIGKGYGSMGVLGGKMGEGREAGWCELVRFSTHLGRDVRLKGEEEVLQKAQPWVLLVCIFFPFLSGWTEQFPLPGVWEWSWPAPHGETEAGCLLSLLQTPGSR